MSLDSQRLCETVSALFGTMRVAVESDFVPGNKLVLLSGEIPEKIQTSLVGLMFSVKIVEVVEPGLFEEDNELFVQLNEPYRGGKRSVSLSDTIESCHGPKLYTDIFFAADNLS
jgi:hypothetical protein